MSEQKVSPSDRGCWYCHQMDDDLVLDAEFDTYVHLDCIKEHLAEGCPEAEIMSYLLKENT